VNVTGSPCSVVRAGVVSAITLPRESLSVLGAVGQSYN